MKCLKRIFVQGIKILYKINNSNGNGRERIKESVTENNKKNSKF